MAETTATAMRGRVRLSVDGNESHMMERRCTYACSMLRTVVDVHMHM